MPINARQAFRALGRNPGFFLFATLILAVGLGPTIAVFSVVEALLLRPLPVERPDELAVLGPGSLGVYYRSDMPQGEIFSYAQYRGLSEDGHGVLESVAAFPTFDTRVYWGGGPESASENPRAACMLVTGTYFPLLGITPHRGRLLGPDDDGAPGSNPVAVVSHGFWTASLGADARAVGSTIRLQGRPYTVVGIASPTFRGHTRERPVEIWVPISMQAEITRSPSRLRRSFPVEDYWLNILVRMRPGVGLARAETAVNARMQEIFLEHSGDGITDERRERLARIRIPLNPMSRGLSRLRTVAATPLMLLWGATGLVLLVACANLGALLLMRASARRNEFRLRAALGAGRLDLMRPVLAESAIVAVTGTGVGLGLAHWLVPLLQGWLQSLRGGGTLDVRIALPVLLFSAAVGILAVFACGLFPALLTARDGAGGALVSSHAGLTPGRGAVRARSLLVGGQIALAVVLVFTAGLFLRTLSALRSTDLGLDSAAVHGIRLDPRGGGFSPESQPDMRRQVLERVRAVSGVQSAAFTGSLPLSGNIGKRSISVSGYTPAEGEEMAAIHVWASPGYFETLGIRLLGGRLPERAERNVVVVNRAFAERYFEDESALGGTLNGSDRIVGVVADVRHVALEDDPPPLVYQTTTAVEGYVPTLAVRVAGPGGGIVQAAREAVREAVPAMPIEPGWTSVAIHLERAIALERMLARLVAAFAAVAVLLCAAGLFGVCAQMVRNRMGEIGLRLALGAGRVRVQALVFRRAAVLLGAGLAVGTAAAVAAGRVVAGLVPMVRPFEWRVLAGTLCALTVCALLAAFAPALRAGFVDPAKALRHE